MHEGKIFLVITFASCKTDELHQAYKLRGMCRRQLGIFPQSMSDFERALRLEPKCYSLARARGNCRLELEKTENVLPSVMRIVAVRNLR